MQPVTVEGFRLSPQQKHIWRLQQGGVSSPYNTACRVLVEGNLDKTFLQRALQEVIARHEILRTHFVLMTDASIPLQIIHEQEALTYINMDIQNLTREEQETVISSLFAATLAHRFDLSSDPLIICYLIQTHSASSTLLFSLPALCADTIGLQQFVQAVVQAYFAIQGSQRMLDEEVNQYADLAEWQNVLLEDADTSKGRAYWEKWRWTSFANKLSLEREPIGSSQFTPQRMSWQVDVATIQRLDMLATQWSIPRSAALLACWQILLWRLQGAKEIVVGYSTPGRKYQELTAAIGLFSKSLPLVLPLHEHMTAQEVALVSNQLSDELTMWEEFFNSAQYFLAEGAPPYFPFSFVYESLEWTCQHSPGGELSFSLAEIVGYHDHFKLALRIQEQGADLLSTLVYDELYYDSAAISQLTEEYQTLLAGLLEQPQEKIGNLPLVGPVEEQQLLETFNRVKQDYSWNSCLPTLFTAQAQRTPTRTAVICGSQMLTYEVLDRRSNQVGHYLRGLGVRPEVVVGVCIERSVELIVAIMGIWKAGGAYLPLDPTLPVPRLQMMLQESRASIVLTQAHLTGVLEDLQARAISLDDEGITSASSTALLYYNHVYHLAYIIYTSGSMGTPKGVMVEHRSPLNLLRSLQQQVYQDLTEEHLQISLNAPITFDASIQQIIQLMYGHTLVIIPTQVRTDADTFIRYLHHHRLDVLDCTPSHLKMLIAAGLLAEEVAPRLLLVAGEAIDEHLWLQLAEAEASGIRIYNIYGPTECTVDATAQKIGGDQQTPLIGRPLPNYQVYILDRQLRPAALGSIGELAIGGDGLARGYLQKPDSTAECFIPHPFSHSPGERLYLTGDFGRYRRDGTIEFVGRKDHQVKIRGYRIELAEIEMALVEYPLIQRAAVLVETENNGDKRLVAYIQLKQHHQAAMVSPEKLAHFLGERLPMYMLPAKYNLVESFPLTRSGKTDRNLLPQIAQQRLRTSTTYVAPQNEVEAILVQVWARTLQVDQIGIDDNYFSLGGDSIRSIQVQSQAREQGLSFSLQALFTYQTIRKLATVTQQFDPRSPQKRDWQPFKLLRAEDSLRLPDSLEDAYPLSWLQRGMIFHSEYSPDIPVYQDIFSFHCQAPLDMVLLEAAVAALIARHPILRTSFELYSYSEPLQLVHRQVKLPVSIEDIRDLNAEEQQAFLKTFLEAEKQRRFSWREAPLMRFSLHRRSEETFQFTVTEHHAILDGWSLATLLTEVFTDYVARLQTQHHAIIQAPDAYFSEFIHLEREAEQSEQATIYWARTLAECVFKPLNWYSADPPLEYQVREVPIPVEVSAGLYSLAQEAAVPLKSVLLAAHLRVLSGLYGPDVVTGFVTNGRPETHDGERTLGLFLNTVPFPQSLKGGSWRDLVQQVFQHELELLPHRRFPFALMQKQQQGQPLFEAIFNFTHFHIFERLQEFKTSGIKVLEMQVFERTNFTLLADFNVNANNGQVLLTLKCNDLSAAQGKSLAGYYQTILTAMAVGQQKLYQEVGLLPEEARRQILHTWNPEQTVFPQEHNLAWLLEQRTRLHPDTIALVCGERALTYHELNQCANRLGHYLRILGIGAESIVGLYCQRSLEMVIALWGILKAGGAYLPLDPEYPLERLRYMVEDAQPTVILTQSDLMESLAAFPIRTVALDKNPEVALQSHRNLEHHTKADNLAYIIYTSGSTGRPKGAMLNHRGMLNHLYAKIRDLGICAEDAIAQTASHCFDISIWQFFSALLVGGTVHIFPDEVAHNPERLLEELTTASITIVELVPSLIQAMLDSFLQRVSNLAHLRWMVSTGEALPIDLCHRWFEAAPTIPLVNAYGPTECSDDVTHMLIERSTPLFGASAPVGRAIANTRIYLLDSHLQPVPVGIPGQLFVGGVGVGRGYLHNPEHTAAVFLPDPFSSEAGERLYQTGDLARYLTDGTIEFMGRIDSQVKLRGYRIELAEIEVALEEHPAIRKAVVSIWEDAQTEKRLVAYLVAAAETKPAISELRQFLQKSIPTYMLPATFVFLETLPLTPNGKVDRKALPTPDQENLRQEMSLVLPRTPLEKSLSKIWADILGLQQVGINDNFFTLGGDSILSIQIIARSRQAGIQLTLKQIFEHQTIAGLATVITTAKPVQADRQWSEHLQAYAQSEQLRQELLYWLAQKREYSLPVDLVGGENSESSSRVFTVTLSSEESRTLLQDVPPAYNSHINDVLLSALLMSFEQWTGKHRLLIDLEDHGKEELFEDLNLSPTVGWFSWIFPVVLERKESAGIGETLQYIKEQLRQIPHHGIGYGILRYLNPNQDIREKLNRCERAEVRFNYLEQFVSSQTATSPFTLAQESGGPMRNQDGYRPYLLDIAVYISGGQFSSTWSYSENIHRGSTIEQLAHNYLAALRQIITHCQSLETAVYTPSDFPDADVSEEDLDKILAHFQEE